MSEYNFMTLLRCANYSELILAETFDCMLLSQLFNMQV